MLIKSVSARRVRDSRKEFTIEVSVNGSRASSPSGKSKGQYETKPYRKNLNWNIEYLNNWSEEIGINRFEDLVKLERFIKKDLRLSDVKDFGANALFAFESAILKALTKEKKKELWEIINPRSRKIPYPVGNCVGGGLHSEDYAKHPDFQEFLVIPKNKSFKKNYKILKYIYEKLSWKLNSIKKNDEGAWQTRYSNKDVLEIVNKVRKKSEKKFNTSIEIGLDIASSSFFKKGIYRYSRTPDKNSNEQLKYLADLLVAKDIYYCEDPFEERDFNYFKKLKTETENNLVVGDDLTATQLKRVKKSVRLGAINALIVKPNQNGSLIEVKKIIDYCKNNKIKTILSHRSGETMDSALADYAVGFGVDYIKCGVSTKWREAKLKRLLKIEKRFK